ncbi:hypothetical protein NUW54_g1980 [Trametes sanguinea]|uniref:Uncharacterized protein n=1 Tax=Trametes sanguinea TaxID=158606 RepID=A0ACC1Q6M6_9APHY|nr:hypothetical protein NUW54_g1980 [Trametes sanguinea]
MEEECEGGGRLPGTLRPGSTGRGSAEKFARERIGLGEGVYYRAAGAGILRKGACSGSCLVRRLPLLLLSLLSLSNPRPLLPVALSFCPPPTDTTSSSPPVCRHEHSRQAHALARPSLIPGIVAVP